MEARISPQGQFHGRVGEGPPDLLGVGVLDGYPQMRGGELVVGSVLAVEARQVHIHLGETLLAPQYREELSGGPVRLGLDVQAG